jgi:hypothetical protein
VPEPPARIMPFHGVELMGDGVLPVGRSLLACYSGAAGCEAGAGPGKHVCLGRMMSTVVGRRGGAGILVRFLPGLEVGGGGDQFTGAMCENKGPKYGVRVCKNIDQFRKKSVNNSIL